jgi:hypothetical protein
MQAPVVLLQQQQDAALWVGARVVMFTVQWTTAMEELLWLCSRARMQQATVLLLEREQGCYTVPSAALAECSAGQVVARIEHVS